MMQQQHVILGCFLALLFVVVDARISSSDFDQVVAGRRLMYSKECAMNEACSGLVGNCCPDDQGDFLDCCPDPRCENYPACSGLNGKEPCCPTADGTTMLDCCFMEAPESPAPTPEPSPNPTSGPTLLPTHTDPSCAAYPLCVDLQGDCCPTEDDVILNCCDGVVPAGTTPEMPEAEVQQMMKENEGVEMGSGDESEMPSAGPTMSGEESATVEPTMTPVPSGFLSAEPTIGSAEPTVSGNEGGEPTAACSAYPACVDANGVPYEGDCCPFTGTTSYNGCCFKSGPMVSEANQAEAVQSSAETAGSKLVSLMVVLAAGLLTM